MTKSALSMGHGAKAPAPVDARIARAPRALTILAYVWAGQALCQLAFFQDWLENGDWSGFVLLGTAIFALILPGNLRLFLVMLAASVVHYVGDWPFVSNHILIDTLLSFTMLVAVVAVLGPRIASVNRVSADDRERIFALLAPVCAAIFIFLYYAILLSKLNEGFFNLEISCMSTMYSYFVERRPLAGALLGSFSIEFLFSLFMIVEAVIPVLLTFRQTRLLGLYIGVPFHFFLGLMGHWAFSSMMISLYFLVAMPAVVDLLGTVGKALNRIAGSIVEGLSGRLLFIGINAGLLAGVLVVRPSVIWLAWTVVLTAVLLLAALRAHATRGLFDGGGALQVWTARPGLVWLMFAVVVVNSASPYIGFKTQTSVAMYSNLRTEGGQNNHLLLPVVPIFAFQDDLIEVVDSNHEVIRELKSHPPRFALNDEEYGVHWTYFEFRRAVSALPADDLEITYRRNGELRTFKRGSADNIDADLDQPLPLLLHKLAYFRPVFKDQAYCLH